MNDFTPLTDKIQTELKNWVRSTGKAFGTLSNECMVNTEVIERIYLGEFKTVRLESLIKLSNVLGIKFEIKIKK